MAAPDQPHRPAPPFAGKVALVTGGNTGIGAAITARLARDGAAVVIAYHEDRAGADELARALVSAGGRGLALPCDVTDPDSVAAVLGDARAEFGPVTLLVNNAAVLVRRPFLEVDDADWAREIDVALTGAYRCSRLALPGMLDAGGGAIVNITSELTALGGALHAPYVAAKSGVEGLTRSLAREFGPAGVRVNAVAPGPTQTRMLSIELPPTFVETIPLRRLGRPEDVVGAVAFLCSEDAAWVTGQTLGVNGGIVMT
jgi:3-oxoacyl-[acyl-carrier protein] reductase